MKHVRIGIDVGGTFTHAVALDALTLAVIDKVKVPTTHQAAEGVALGIIQSLQTLLAQANIKPEEVRFIAHSTTQATNALLEGDVAPVGIIGMGSGADSLLAKLATNIRHLQLAPGKFLTTYYKFLDTGIALSDEKITAAIEDLVRQGAKAIAVSEAFAVDNQDNELKVLDIARRMGLPATSGAEISQLYGLKVRTRTAVINASMLPKMIESANMTEQSVREAGIQAPIMIMRSDGGVMDIDAMRKRPILTMLSGPAAGVAAAMMYLHISDGIFLEVGGTSTDISAIRNGRALVKSAEVGGHRVYMRTLDVRTVGVAGGSMLRIKDGRLIDVGPRSAHIAGLGYVSFADHLNQPQMKFLHPCAGDPGDYVAFIETPGADQLSSGQGSDAEDSAVSAARSFAANSSNAGQRSVSNQSLAPGISALSEQASVPKPNLCPTTTCASNMLDLVPSGDCALGKKDLIEKAFQTLSEKLNLAPQAVAEAVLTLASQKCTTIVSQLIKDYKLDAEMVTLVGGGGGAAAIVPFVAREMKLRHYLAQNADVISAIGVALALVRETVERQIVQPTNDDILRIRQEAFASVEKMGADISTIEVLVEVDARTNTVRATAYGSTSKEPAGVSQAILSREDQLKLVTESMRVAAASVALLAENNSFQVYGATKKAHGFLGLLNTKIHSLRTLDQKGTIRLQTKNGFAQTVSAAGVEKAISDLAEDHAQYGDAGKVIPNFMLLAGAKIVDLSGLPDVNQVLALAKIEVETLPKDAPCIVIAAME